MRYLHPDTQVEYNQNILDEDEALSKAFSKLGMETKRVAWDDPNQDWLAVKDLVIRTPWNYFDQFSEFKPWLEKISNTTRLYNRAKTLFLEP